MLDDFLGRLDEFEGALAGYEQDGNTVTLQTIEDARSARPRPHSRASCDVSAERRGDGCGESNRSRRGGRSAAAGFAIFHGQWPTSQLYGATICRSPSGERKIALTYDDGPNPVHTPRLMKILERYDAHATFFLIGKWAEREPELIRELHAAGHAIGNHTYTHPTMPLLSLGGGDRRAGPLPRGGRGGRGRVLAGRRRGADAPALRAPASRDPARDARGGLRAGHLVDHLLRLARDRDRAQDRAPRRRARSRAT